MEQIIVEIINPGKRHNDFRTFNAQSITIGRGLDNDCIIDDPFVSARHCHITFDEKGLSIEDINSKNGIFLIRINQKIKKAEIQSGDEIVFGQTHVKIYLSSHKVEPVKILLPAIKILTLIKKPLYAWFLIPAFLGFTYLFSWMGTIKKDEQGQIILSVAIALVITLLWAGFWTFLGRLFRHRIYWTAHISIACLYSLTTYCVSGILDYAAFYMNNEMLYIIGSLVVYAAISVLGFWAHLTFATRMTNKAKIISSSAVTLILLLLFGAIMNYEIESRYLKQNYFVSLNPPYVGTPKALTIDEVIERSETVFQRK